MVMRVLFSGKIFIFHKKTFYPGYFVRHWS